MSSGQKYPTHVPDRQWIRSLFEKASALANEALRAAQGVARVTNIALPTLSSGWSNTGGAKLQLINGVVTGQLNLTKSSAMTDGETIMTLVSGYRPLATVNAPAVLMATGSTTGVAGVVSISSAGVVKVLTFGASSKVLLISTVSFTLS